MNSVGSHGSLSLPFVMKVMVCHFVSDSHEVMTVLIVVLPLIVVVKISQQLHQDFGNVVLKISESEVLFSHCCAATGISSYSATRLQCGSTSQSSQECHYILVQFFSMHCFSRSPVMYITLCIAVCKQMAEEIGVMINELCIMHLLLAEETGVMINSLCIMQLLHVAVE
jgi:hypothetical protein